MQDQEIKIDTSRKSPNITGRNVSTSRISNVDKIYNYLLEQDKALTTTEISNNTKINIKNISRYLKALESKGLIVRNTIQEGKRRLVYVKIKDNQNREIITSRNDPSITSRSKLSIDGKKLEDNGIRENKISQSDSTTRNELNTDRKGPNITSRSKNTRGPGSKIKIITINSIFEKVIEYTSDKMGKGYERINKILKSHDKNRNYQSNIIRDAIEILIEMGKVR